MTEERRPPGVRFETWVDRQIREAAERGAFDDLPGAGKPIPDIDRPLREGEWVGRWARRSGVSGTAFLPPALALAKECEDLPGLLDKVRSEQQVRRIVTDLNARIREAYRTPHPGPAMVARPLDLEATVAAWRERRPH